MVESKWLENWFSDLRNVNDFCAARCRTTYITVYGVPLIGWGYENFYNISGIFGRVISVDYYKFECSKITVLTDCLFSINCKMIMEIEDKQYTIFISESYAQQASKENHRHQTQNPAQSPVSTPSHGDSADSTTHANGLNSPGINAIKCLVSPTINDPIINPSDPTFPKFGNPKYQIPKTKNPNSPHASPSAQNDISSILPPIIGINNHTPSPMDQAPTIQIIETKTNQPEPKTSPNPPIPISNKFWHLIKQKKPTPPSSTSSGPIFPPGFEDTIPYNVKKIHLTKRMKKTKKKASRVKSDVKNQLPPPKSTPPKHNITASETLELATILEMDLNGPTSILESCIDSILTRQQSDWAAATR